MVKFVLATSFPLMSQTGTFTNPPSTTRRWPACRVIRGTLVFGSGCPKGGVGSVVPGAPGPAGGCGPTGGCSSPGGCPLGGQEGSQLSTSWALYTAVSSCNLTCRTPLCNWAANACFAWSLTQIAWSQPVFNRSISTWSL